MNTRWALALAGAAATALALGTGELVAAVVGAGSPIASIGAVVIDLQPPGAKDLMVELFGEADKLVLEIATAAGALLLGALLGLVAGLSLSLARAGFVAFGLVAGIAIARDPVAGPPAAVLIAAVSLGVGLIALPLLVRRAALPAGTARSTGTAGPPAAEPGEAGDVGPGAGSATNEVARRSFLRLAAGVFAIGAVLVVVGRGLSARVPVLADPIALPEPVEPLPPLPAGAGLGIAGVAPIVVPAGEFYRIDTRLTVPRLDADTWQLRIHGMVEREIVLSYRDLLALPLIERYVTLACVSNQVGGDLVGNARWTGTLLRSVLDRAGVLPGATQIVGRSFDGWTGGFPTAHLDGEGAESLIAVGMNGESLPAQHGFPARLVVPGLYGYVSATKWLTEIELTTLESFDAYWVPLGWAKEAPILTQSRIDVPRRGATLTAGPVEVAGVAWAPARGVSKVEVQLDDGPWQAAELSLPLSDAAWVQWRAAVELAAGSHTVRVRATDGTGEVQTSDRTPPAPDGARGYHEITLTAG
jgi:DMSO/TMAO reductase YedYZ molybdopterin-dependent catalytic subunit